MCYPPGSEKQGSSCCKVERIIDICGDMKVISYMIQCHKDHDNAPQYVDRFNSAFRTNIWGHKCL